VPEIITIGEMLVEIMTKTRGQSFLNTGELLGPYPSGAPAIFIDQVAKMGVNCGIVSKVGNDQFGEMILTRLINDGVDVSQVQISDEFTTGTAFVTYFENDSRHYIFHLNQSASAYIDISKFPESFIENCKYLHIMGCSISVSDTVANAIVEIAKAAKLRGALISFDPNIRIELKQTEIMKNVLKEVLDISDIILSSESEIASLHNLLDIDNKSENLFESEFKLIILKNGSKGVKVFDGLTYEFIEPYIVDEVDPTGAGDCFDGAFLAMMLNGRSVHDAAIIANAAGALSVTKQGPMEGVFCYNEILRFINEN